MKTQLITIALILSAIQTQAQNINIVQVQQNTNVRNIIINKYYPDNCIYEDWVELNTQPVSKVNCKVTEALSLEQTTKSYPRMNNMTFNVQYWNAAAVKTATYRSMYDRYITNYCTHKQVAVRRENIIWSDSEFVRLDNPNLSDKISASYELSPMTDSEAKQAFAQLCK